MEETNEEQVSTDIAISEDSIAAVSMKMEDGVLTLSAKVDIVEAAKAKAEESTNTIDDVLVTMLEMAESGLDWKGYAKKIL